MLESGGADTYDLQVRIKSGQNPDLVLTASSTRAHEERIDLTQYHTQEELHALMRNKGLSPVQNVLRDTTSECVEWAHNGQCLTNPSYMRTACPRSCASLTDAHESCGAWARQGECDKNPKFMYPTCPIACGWKTEL